MDVFHDVGYQTFRKDATHMRIDQFINDDHCENITRFKKHELLDLIDRLELNEQVYVHHHDGHFYRFHREELVIHVLNKLAFGNPRSFMADQIFGGDCTKWGKGHNFLLSHLDERFGELVNINSLNIWVSMFPMFAEAARLKYCQLWDKYPDVPGENTYTNPNTFNIFGLMDICVHEIYRPGSGPIAEG